MKWTSSTLDDFEGHWQQVRLAVLATAGVLVHILRLSQINAALPGLVVTRLSCIGRQLVAVHTVDAETSFNAQSSVISKVGVMQTLLLLQCVLCITAAVVGIAGQVNTTCTNRDLWRVYLQCSRPLWRCVWAVQRCRNFIYVAVKVWGIFPILQLLQLR